MSTSSVVPGPALATWASKAARSSSCSSVNAWAVVPTVGMPYSCPAARFDVAAKPASQAARAAATAACSWLRRLPISTRGRPPAASTIRAAAAAIAESWFRTERTKVSSSTDSANVPVTVSTGEPGKYSSPSG